MKQLCRIACLFLCFFMILSVDGLAACADIDVSTAPDGFFSVFYPGDASLKMKVGVTVAGQTTYYDYTPGARASYAIHKGDGSYTVALYRNLSGSRYQKVATKTVSVRLTDPLAPYLASTTEISFEADGAVSQTAAALCRNLTDPRSKVVAIHNFIARNFSYDNSFAAAVRNGTVRQYTTNTEQALRSRQGVCYDFSALFAAMCRSQGIPCALMKGYTASGYHAWNRVWVDGTWVTMDVTAAVAARTQASCFADCIAFIR